MFENKKHELVPFPLFLLRVLRYFIYSIMFICFSLLLGVLGYHFIARLSWIDSLYNASMILTGMGPVAVLTTGPAKLFASVYALYSGIAFLSTVAVFFAPIVHRFMHKMHLESENSQQ
jgi:Ca2+/Na+ antiporter